MLNMNAQHNCPNCDSQEFITEPNQYDILIFNEAGFIVYSTEQVDNYKIYCRECGKEVDITKTSKEIVLKEEKDVF